jgi:hypothetical protein
MAMKRALARPLVLVALVAGVLTLTGQVAPASTVIDLTTAGASNGVGSLANLGGNFIVQQISPQSTGTGVIDSFLRIQQDGTERGFNTSVNNPPLDDKAGNFTRALLLSEIPTVTIGGTDYLQFLLDINQNGNNKLSLNQIEILQAASDPGLNFTIAEASTTQEAVLGLTGGTEIFQMSNATKSLNDAFEIQMDFSLNSGSGSGDMFLYVPKSDFLSNLDNVILFAQFGAPPGAFSSNDGFEEWAVLKPPGSIIFSAVPEPSTWALAAVGLATLGAFPFLKRRLPA